MRWPSNESLSPQRMQNFDPGGFCEYVRVPALQTDRGVYPLPDHVTYEEGSFVEPLACPRGNHVADAPLDRVRLAFILLLCNCAGQNVNHGKPIEIGFQSRQARIRSRAGFSASRPQSKGIYQQQFARQVLAPPGVVEFRRSMLGGCIGWQINFL